MINGLYILIENFDKAISYFCDEIYDACFSMIVHLFAMFVEIAIILFLGIVCASRFSAYVFYSTIVFPAWTVRKLAFEEVGTCLSVE